MDSSSLEVKSDTSSEREFRRKSMWRCCDGTIDSRAVHVFVQFTVTVLVLGLCVVELIKLDPRDTGPVWGLLGSITGYWFGQNGNTEKPTER